MSTTPAPARRTPILVGVGEVKNRSSAVEEAIEPLHLMLQAIRSAAKDTKLSSAAAIDSLEKSIDSIDVVATWTWPYPDLPALLAQHLGAQPAHQHYSEHGGNQPAKLLDEAARRISTGASNVTVLTGGDALASLTACAAAGKIPPSGWTKPAIEVTSIPSPTSRDLGNNIGGVHSIGAPIHVYPLYENGFRAHRAQSLAENNVESARLYAAFAQVAERHPAAWNYGKPAETEQFIGTVTKKNRMICSPYPLFMNAFNTVNLAAACILTSTEHAEQLGIPKSQWIYPLGGAGTNDSSTFWERPNFYTSPSISRSLDAGLKVSGLSKDQIDLYDFYSCFPIVPKLACHHLGLPILHPPKPITLLGGLTSFGGAGNNYSMHAIVQMVRELRNGNGQHGLVLANGGILSYQYVVCLSSQARTDGSSYPNANPLPSHVDDLPVPPTDATAEGDAVIETYTVEFKRDGNPLRGYIIGRLKSTNHRFVANHGDESTLSQLANATDEIIGRSGWVGKDESAERRNLFWFERKGRL